MEITFKIAAVILAGVAAYFLWLGNAERAFIAAVFGAVSFFLSFRAQVKRRLAEREAARLEEEMRSEEEAEIEDISGTDAPQLNEMPANEQISREQLTTDNEQKI